MSEDLKQHVGELPNVTGLPTVDLGRAFFESTGGRAELSSRKPGEHGVGQLRKISLGQVLIDLPPRVPNLLLCLELIGKGGRALRTMGREGRMFLGLGQTMCPACACLESLGKLVFPLSPFVLANAVVLLVRKLVYPGKHVLQFDKESAEGSLLQIGRVLSKLVGVQATLGSEVSKHLHSVPGPARPVLGVAWW
jgi:hypothetical protein